MSISIYICYCRDQCALFVMQNKIKLLSFRRWQVNSSGLWSVYAPWKWPPKPLKFEYQTQTGLKCNPINNSKPKMRCFPNKTPLPAVLKMCHKFQPSRAKALERSIGLFYDSTVQSDASCCAMLVILDPFPLFDELLDVTRDSYVSRGWWDKELFFLLVAIFRTVNWPVRVKSQYRHRHAWRFKAARVWQVRNRQALEELNFLWHGHLRRRALSGIQYIIQALEVVRLFN